jgi:16S rRNA C1402 N4-methylase RsmH
MWKECIDALLDCQRSVQRRQQQQHSDNSPSENNDTTVNNTANHNHNTSPSLIFVDGTLGGGGHTAALLERLQPGDVVLGCDVDPAALEVACRRLEPHLGRPVQQPLPQDHQPQQQQEDQEQQSSQDQLLPLLVPVT